MAATGRLAVSLRSVSEADEGFLRLVYAESRREELARVQWPAGVLDAFLRMQFDAQAKHYREHYPGAEFLVVLLDGAPAGRLYVHRAEEEIRVMDIALLSAARGKGIGTALLKQVLAEAAAAARRVSIHVEKFNPAMRLYEQLGFRVAADREVYWLMEWRG
jgi:ribosomal protein S18 acetylase RimI-like enzyme